MPPHQKQSFYKICIKSLVFPLSIGVPPAPACTMHTESGITGDCWDNARCLTPFNYKCEMMMLNIKGCGTCNQESACPHWKLLHHFYQKRLNSNWMLLNSLITSWVLRATIKWRPTGYWLPRRESKWKLFGSSLGRFNSTPLHPFVNIYKTLWRASIFLSLLLHFFPTRSKVPGRELLGMGGWGENRVGNHTCSPIVLVSWTGVTDGGLVPMFLASVTNCPERH